MAIDHKMIIDLLEGMVSRNPTKLSNVLAEEAVWHTPPSSIPAYAGPHRGLGAILNLVAGAGGDLFELGSQRVEIEHIVAEGDIAAAQFRQIATTKSGRNYNNLYSFFFRCKNGKIVEVWENLDTGYFYGVFKMTPDWVSL